MIRSHWEIISKILFSESLSYGSMDLEKILEYFIRFESLPAKGNARIRPQNVDLSEFFFAPTSRSLIQDISPPRSVVQVVCKFRGGENLLSPREKYLLSALCVFDLALLFTPLPCLIQILLFLLYRHPTFLLFFPFLVRLHLVITPSPLRRSIITTYYWFTVTEVIAA